MQNLMREGWEWGKGNVIIVLKCIDYKAKFAAYAVAFFYTPGVNCA